MTPGEVPELEDRLRRRFPHSALSVEVVGHQLRVQSATCELWTPAALDYRGLSMAEWAHRVTDALRAKLGDP